jgi:acyl-CoA thioester hydrolase
VQTDDPALDDPAPEDWDSIPVRVYYEDTDAQGIVYFANYLRFMERGRTEWLRSRGVEQDSLRREQNLLFSLASTAVKFLGPARFNDKLIVRTRVSRVSGARVVFAQAVHRDDASDELLCSADCVAACITADEFKPRRLPAGLLDR